MRSISQLVRPRSQLVRALLCRCRGPRGGCNGFRSWCNEIRSRCKVFRSLCDGTRSEWCIEVGQPRGVLRLDVCSTSSTATTRASESNADPGSDRSGVRGGGGALPRPRGALFLSLAALAATLGVSTQGYRGLTQEAVALTVTTVPTGPGAFRRSWSSRTGGIPPCSYWATSCSWMRIS